MNKRKDAAEATYEKETEASSPLMGEMTGLVQPATDLAAGITDSNDTADKSRASAADTLPDVDPSCSFATSISSTYRAVFFDLDGTLLPMELDEFLSSYFATLTAFVANHGLDTATFSKGLKAGIGAMTQHEDNRTNAEAFWSEFFAHVDTAAVDWIALLNDFYENEFGKIGADVCPNPVAVRAVQALVAKGYPLVLATMPMFPKRAVEWRLSWAGVDPSLFARITTFENSTSVKPKPAYCAENLAACGLAGSEVLMVGNNTVEDGVFTSLGTDLYLVTDHLLDPIGAGVEGVLHGTIEEFAAWVEALPACENPTTPIDNGVIDATAKTATLVANLQVNEDEVARAVHASSTFNAGAAGSMGDAFKEGV